METQPELIPRLPLQEGKSQLHDYAKRNMLPPLADRELAALYRSQYPHDERFRTVEDASALRRAVSGLDQGLATAGEAVYEGIKGVAPEGFETAFGGVGRGGEMLTNVLPEMAMMLASSRVPGLRTAVAGGVVPGLAAMRSYDRPLEQGGGDMTKALVEGLSWPASYAGAMGGTALARNAGGGAVVKALAGAAGGSLPDVALIAGYGDGDTPAERVTNFFTDPEMSIGFALANAPFAAMDALHHSRHQRTKEAGERFREQLNRDIEKDLETADDGAIRGMANQLGIHGYPSNTADQVRTALRMLRERELRTVDDAQGWLRNQIPRSEWTPYMEKEDTLVDVELTETEAQDEAMQAIGQDQSTDITGLRSSHRMGEPDWRTLQKTGDEVDPIPGVDFAEFAGIDRAGEPYGLKPIEYWNLTKDVGGYVRKPGQQFTLDRAKIEEIANTQAHKSKSFDPQVNGTFFTNNLIETFNRATSSRPGSLGPSIRVGADGKLGSKGLKKLMRKTLTQEELSFYPLNSLPSRMSPEEFATWVHEQTPKVEIQNLRSNNASESQTRREQAIHLLDTRGYRVVEGDNIPGSYRLLRGDETVSPGDVDPEIANAFDMVAYGEDVTSDSAYASVSPQGADTFNRKNGVAVLIRQGGETKHEGGHFGQHDKNVLAFFRGYEEGNTFVMIEGQSDWQSLRAKILKSMPNIISLENLPKGWNVETMSDGFSILNPEGKTILMDTSKAKLLSRYKNFRRTRLSDLDEQAPPSPLLPKYEKLAIKSAINYARSHGLDKIAILDADSAMMTESHDKDLSFMPGEYVNEALKKFGPFTGRIKIGKKKPGDFAWAAFSFEISRPDSKPEWVSNPNPYLEGIDQSQFPAVAEHGIPKQIGTEGGMRRYYDRGGSLHKLARQLTNTKGKFVRLGEHERGSEFLTEPSQEGGPKRTITAFEYSLDKLSPDATKLFSAYRMAEAGAITQELETRHQDIEGYVRELTTNQDGAPSERLFKAAMVFINSLNTGNLSQISKYLNPHSDAFAYVTKKGDININEAKVSLLDAQQAFGILGHEATHVTLRDLELHRPDLFKEMSDFATQQTQAQRVALLTEAAKLAKVELPQRYVEYLAGSDAKTDFEIIHELYSGFTEIMANAHFHNAKQAPGLLRRLLEMLPPSVLGFFERMLPWTRRALSDPSYFRDGNMSDQLTQALGLMHGTVFEAKADGDLAAARLRHFQKFSGENLRESIEKGQSPLEGFDFDSVPEDLRLYAKDFAAKMDPRQEGMGFIWRNLATQVGVGRIYPQVSRLISRLAHIRGQGTVLHQQFLSALGSIKNPDADHNANLTRAQEMINKTQKKSFRDGVSKVFLENQRRIFRGDEPFTEAEMLNQGLNPEQIEFVQGTDRMMAQIAMADIQADSIQVAWRSGIILQHAAPEAPSSLVQETLKASIPVMRNIGRLQQNIQVLERRLRKVAETQPVLAEHLQRKIAENAQKRAELEEVILADLGEKIPGLEIMGEGGLTPAASAFIGSIRMQFKDIAQKAHSYAKGGYVPLVRRGNYIVRVFGPDNHYLPIEVRGFRTKASAEAYQAQTKKRDPSLYVESFDKQSAVARYQGMTPFSVERLSYQSSMDHQEFMNQIRNSEVVDTNNPEIQRILKMIENELPLKKQLSEIVSTKGIAFNRKRHLVEGYKQDDLLPNIFDYINIKTAEIVKKEARAFAYSEMNQPSVIGNPQLMQHVSRLTDYALRGNKADAAKTRAFVFGYYMLGTVKHMIQNLTQPYHTGITQIMADGDSSIEALSSVMTGSKLAVSHLLRGTTGDKVLDGLLMRAKEEHLTEPNVYHEMIGSDELTNAVSHINKFQKGDATLGHKIARAPIQGLKGVLELFKQWYQISEQVNRRTMFIAAYKSKTNKGVRDLEEIYDYGNRLNEQSNFLGSAANRPGFVQSMGNAPAAHWPTMAMLSLRNFVMGNLTQQATFVYEAVHGRADPKTGEVVNDHKFLGLHSPAAKALAMQMFVMSMMAGLLGVTLATDIDELFKAYFGINMREALRRKVISFTDLLEMDSEAGGIMADTAEFGLPALVGVDPGISLGLGSVAGLRARGGSPQLLDGLIGPIGGLLGNLSDAYGYASEGDKRAAFKSVAPNMLKHHLNAWEIWKHDQTYTRSGDVVQENFTPSEKVAVTTGWNAAKTQKTFRARMSEQESEMARQDERKTYVREIATALHDGRQAKAQQLWREYFSETDPLQDKLSFLESIDGALARRRGPVTEPANLSNLQTSNEIRGLYPDLSFQQRSPTDPVIGKLQVAKMLGAYDEVMLQMKQMGSTLRRAGKLEMLEKAGIPRQVASLLLARGTRERLRTRRSQDAIREILEQGLRGQDPRHQVLP